MIVGIVLGILGLLVCIFALKCIRIGSMEDTAKANMTLTSGIMFIVAGKWELSCLPCGRFCISLELRNGRISEVIGIVLQPDLLGSSGFYL